MQDVIVMGKYSKADFEEFVMSQMTLDNNYSRASVSFDIAKIAHHVRTGFLDITKTTFRVSSAFLLPFLGIERLIV